MILDETGEDVDEVAIEVKEKDLTWSLVPATSTKTSLATSIDIVAPTELVSPVTEDCAVSPTPWVDPPPKLLVDPSELPLKKPKPNTAPIGLNVVQEADECILDMTMDKKIGDTFSVAIGIDSD